VQSRIGGGQYLDCRSSQARSIDINVGLFFLLRVLCCIACARWANRLQLNFHGDSSQRPAPIQQNFTIQKSPSMCYSALQKAEGESAMGEGERYSEIGLAFLYSVGGAWVAPLPTLNSQLVVRLQCFSSIGVGGWVARCTNSVEQVCNLLDGGLGLTAIVQILAYLPCVPELGSLRCKRCRNGDACCKVAGCGAAGLCLGAIQPWV
jgi:hypothetical protein